MNITVKQAAMQKFKTLGLSEKEGIRIKATYIGSCSLYIEYDLQVDQIKENDSVYTFQPINILISEESKKHLDHTLIVDYNPSLGFKLASSEETYRYNIQL